ncbi:MAG: cation transporter [Cyclobacteriaceae bacterium]|nr:cation transporter [Cyclobacteriaceae bacterium]
MHSAPPLSLSKPEHKLYSVAFALAIFTIVYNLVEGILATYFGYEDETLTLFGFGIDSFIEMISGIGIVYMILRIRKNPTSSRGKFERTALRITGYSFYILTSGLLLSAAFILYTGQKPETTFWGVVISLISIVVMLLLIYGKIKIGKKLQSEPILADANCTKVCIYMSVILLVSSGIYELTHLPYLDAAGTLGLAWFSYREGQECFEKAATNKSCSCDHE